jgi:hypothetical protein
MQVEITLYLRFDIQEMSSYIFSLPIRSLNSFRRRRDFLICALLYSLRDAAGNP